MNCCNEYGDCRQGRDCPIRKERVAHIGRKDYDRDPLPPTVWRAYMHHLAKWMLIVLLALVVASIVLAGIVVRVAA